MEKPLIYLDNCCFNRPFDDQSQISIQLETHAKLHVQRNIIDGAYALAWSYILDFENSKNPYPDKRSLISMWKHLASVNISEETEAILQCASRIVEVGGKTFDALHISCAEAAKCDHFLTTDKRLRKLAPKLPVKVSILTPIEFITQEER